MRRHPVNEALRIAVARLLAAMPSARLACVNVLKQGRVTLDTTLDEAGHNKHIDRMVALRHWAAPLKLDESGSPSMCWKRSIRRRRSSISRASTVSITS